MGGMLCLSSELNYLDRQTLSVLASTIQKDLGFSTVEYSQITAAFLFSYMAHALARTAKELAGFRILLGATEAAVIPAGV
jgi:MFS transporter, ACS family, hexuronate transporter